jgi:hypothetical protein
MSCSVLDHSNVLSQNVEVDPIKPQNLSRARGQSGLSRDWIKVESPDSPAMIGEPREAHCRLAG